jgi:hypothetical protein
MVDIAFSVQQAEGAKPHIFVQDDPRPLSSGASLAKALKLHGLGTSGTLLGSDTTSTEGTFNGLNLSLLGLNLLTGYYPLAPYLIPGVPVALKKIILSSGFPTAPREEVLGSLCQLAGPRSGFLPPNHLQ